MCDRILVKILKLPCESAKMYVTFVLVLLWTGGGFSQCYTTTSCTGRTVTAVTERDCCVGTDDGLAFRRSSGVCYICVGELRLISCSYHSFHTPYCSTWSYPSKL